MENAIRTRAASLAAAAGLCGAALLAALGMQFKFVEFGAPPAPPPIVTEFEREPDPPPPKPIVNTPRAAPPMPTDLDETPFAPPLDEPMELTALPLPDPFSAAPPEIAQARWLERPRNLQRYYPPRALTRGVEGQVRLECVVSTEGWLTRCTVLAETPAGWGFAQAAIRIAREHRMVPATRDGIPVEARYRMTVPFTVA